MEFLQSLQDIVMPIYEALFKPLIDLYGYWTIALFVAILSLTSLSSFIFSKYIKKDRLKKDLIIVVRYLLTTGLIFLASYVLYGTMLSIQVLASTSLIASVTAGLIYASIKFLGIKGLLGILGSALISLAKHTSLSADLSKKLGVNKFVIDKVFDAIEIEVEKIKATNQQLANYDAYIQAEKTILAQVKTILNGLIDTNKISLDNAILEVDNMVKTKLSA